LNSKKQTVNIKAKNFNKAASISLMEQLKVKGGSLNYQSGLFRLDVLKPCFNKRIVKKTGIRTTQTEAQALAV